jgi:hypothetical protein
MAQLNLLGNITLMHNSTQPPITIQSQIHDMVGAFIGHWVFFCTWTFVWPHGWWGPCACFKHKLWKYYKYWFFLTNYTQFELSSLVKSKVICIVRH